VGGDVVTGYDHAGVGLVDRPAHRVAVISAPGPDVVDDRVPGVVQQTDRRRNGGGRGAADAEVDILDEVRIAGGTGPGVPDREQDGRVDRAGVNDQAGHLHPAVRHELHGRV